MFLYVRATAISTVLCLVNYVLSILNKVNIQKLISYCFCFIYRGAVVTTESVCGGDKQGLRRPVLAVSRLWRRISARPVHRREAWRHSSRWRHVGGLWYSVSQWAVSARWQTAARQLVPVSCLCWEPCWSWTTHRDTRTCHCATTLWYAPF